METIAGLPFYPLEITKDGKIFSQQQKAAIEAAVQAADTRPTDLFVIAHGWNNDTAEARELYTKLFTHVAALIPNHAPAAGRKFAIVGVFWPSKRFADDDLIPSGGAVSLDDDQTGVTSLAVKTKLESLKDAFDFPDAAALDRAKKLVDTLQDNPKNQREFVDIIRSFLPRKPADTREDASDKFLSLPGDEILKSLSPPSMFAFPPAEGGGSGSALSVDDAVGGAAGLGDFFSGAKAAAWRLLNYATYYQMKERAGVVGTGLNAMLGAVRNLRPDLRIHLIGHSFGARVATAAVDGPVALRPSSMSLLQGAFSHNGFAEKFDQKSDGFFRKVVAQSKVNGPIIVTHTINDRAVGIAYPLASRISLDNRSAFGDENDIYGGMGRNGAVKMKAEEVVKGQLLPHTSAYQFAAKKVYNLKADQFISGHSDVTGQQVANAIVRAATAA